MAISKQQRKILETLDSREERDGSLSTHDIGEALRLGFRDSIHGYYDRAHSSLARLQKRGLVERLPKRGNAVAQWLITQAGRDAIKT